MKLLVVLAHQQNLQQNLTIKNAYVNADLDVILKVKIPLGFHFIHNGNLEGKYLLLNKALYGTSETGNFVI
jgi:hypothetical protein